MKRKAELFKKIDPLLSQTITVTVQDDKNRIEIKLDFGYIRLTNIFGNYYLKLEDYMFSSSNHWYKWIKKTKTFEGDKKNGYPLSMYFRYLKEIFGLVYNEEECSFTFDQSKELNLRKQINSFIQNAEQFDKINPLEWKEFQTRYHITIFSLKPDDLPYLQIELFSTNMFDTKRSAIKFIFTYEGQNYERLVIRIWYLGDKYNHWYFANNSNNKEFLPSNKNNFQDKRYNELKDALSIVESLVKIKYNPKRNSFTLGNYES